MFNKLVASDRARRGLFGAKTMTVSLVVHGLLLAGAVYASVAAPAEAEKAEEEVTFVEIEEKQPEPPAEAEPPPPPPSAPATPPPPKGFQELVPPDEPPMEIPEVDLSEKAVSVEDFTGIGVAGGTSRGIEGGTPQNTAAVDSSNFAYEVAVLDAPPEISNRNQLGSILARYYPRMLQEAGIGGETVMQFIIQPDGKVDPSSIRVVSSTHEQFRSASESAVERFRFRPGKYKGQAVRVLIQIPIAWQPAK